MAWLAAKPGRESALGATRAADVRSLVKRFGGVPKGFQDQYGDITPEDLAAAQADPFSIEAGIQRGYDQGVEAFKKNLAARGGLQSGELGYQQNQADLSRGFAESQASNTFTDALTQGIKDYTGGMTGIANEYPGILDTAKGNVVASNPHYPDVAASYDDASSSQYGVPLYKTEDGRLFNVDGSAFQIPGTPGTPATPAAAAPAAAAPPPVSSYVPPVVQSPQVQAAAAAWKPPTYPKITNSSMLYGY